VVCDPTAQASKTMSARDVYDKSIRQMPAIDRLRLASLILDDLAGSGGAGLDISDEWNEQDMHDLAAFAVKQAGPEEDGDA
jgi:hypothetical protein